MREAQMFQKKTLSHAISALTVSAITATSAHAQLEEVVVTATKRTESAQDIPITI